jgi:parvulin-like peptidyl-prolyl isomerase
MKRIRTAALAAAFSFVGVAASAQGIVADPGTIAGCLCNRQSVVDLKVDMDRAQQTYDQDRSGVATMDQQLTAARASVDVANQEQVDAVKAMNLQREQLYARTYDVDLPMLQAAIKSYNDSAAGYGQQCANRNFDSVVMSQVSATLTCRPTH